jgi:hypothetical protein
MKMENFGKKLSNYNEVTGNTIITSTKNQSVFEENYEKIQNGEAALEAAQKQQVTMFPITFAIPQHLYKELEVLGKTCNMSPEKMAQRIFIDDACSE